MSAGDTQDGMTVTGTADDDTVDCSAAISGMTINGGGGVDTIIGGAGVDTLVGGGGVDMLNGGVGMTSCSRTRSPRPGRVGKKARPNGASAAPTIWRSGAARPRPTSER